MTSADDYPAVALAFAKALASRDYDGAYAMTSTDFQRLLTRDEMRAAFEAIVPADWGTLESVDAGHTMTEWPGMEPSDVGWAYVSIGGDVYSEAVIVIVSTEDGVLKVRHVEFGRP